MAIRKPLHNRPDPGLDGIKAIPEALSKVPPSAVQTPLGAMEGGMRYRSPSRVGKRAAVAWLEPAAVKQLGIEAIKRDMTVQDILVQAINDWFAANGLPRFDVS